MKIISIELSRDNKHILEFINGNITKSSSVPIDYTINDLTQIVYDSCKGSIIETTIVCDRHGMGIAFWDRFNMYEKERGKLDNVLKIDTILFPPEHQNNIAKFITDKSRVKKIYKVFKNCDSLFLKVECDKLINDIERFTYETKANGRIGLKSDDCLNKERAYCLLQVVALDLCEYLK